MRRWTLALAVLLAGLAPVWAADAPVAPSTNKDEWVADFDAMVAAMKATHPALYHHSSAAEMDAYAARFRGELAHDTWPEYVMGMYGMLALVGDGHTTFYPQPDAGPGFDTRYPILTQVFADGVYVVGADKAYAGAVGGKLVAITGHPVGEVFRATVAHWDHENEMWPLNWLPFVLRRPGYLSGMHIAARDVAAPAVFTVEKDGKRTDYAVTPVVVEADSAGQANWVRARDEAHVAQPTPLHGKDMPFDFVWLADKRTVYAVYNQCADGDAETVAAFAARLFKFIDANPVDKLIIDVRKNGGGDNYKNQPLILGMISSKVNVPGHLFVLTGRQTFSAAQNFSADAERWTQAIFVGEPTGSAPNIYGDAKQMELPHTHLHPMFSTIYWEQSDPRDKRPWILPDVPAPVTFADYLSGRDPVLAAALAYRADPGVTPLAPNLHWTRPSQKAGWQLPL
jgi:hypothetical protein